MADRNPASPPEEVLERLRREMYAFPEGIFPTMADLALRYGISVPTLRRVLQQLVHEGRIIVHQGRRARIVDAKSPAPEYTPPLPAATRVYRELKKRITDGVYEPGTPLPKLLVIAGEVGVSYNTAAKAIRMLSSKSLVHKEKGKWHAGRKVVRSAQSAGASSHYVVAILLRDMSSWESVTSTRSNAFIQALTTQCEKYRIRLMPLFSEERKVLAETVPGGLAGARKIISDLGERYLGSVIAGSRNEIRNLDEWMKSLCHAQRPVVWFDRYDESPEWKRAQPGCFRCHFSEVSAVRCAAEYCIEAGHRRVAFWSLGENVWRHRRSALLEDFLPDGSRFSAAVNSINEAWEPLLSENNDASIIQVIQSVADTYPQLKLHRPTQKLLQAIRPGGPYENILNRLRKNAVPSVWSAKPAEEFKRRQLKSAILLHVIIPPLLADMPSILICGNDIDASLVFHWRCVFQSPVVSSLSTLSFDNNPDYLLLPTTTVDFGLGFLGERAFHILLGDAPIGHQSGNIAARPHIVHRGSVRHLSSTRD